MTDNTDARWWRIEDLFAQALDLPAEEQNAFLDELPQTLFSLREPCQGFVQRHQRFAAPLRHRGGFFERDLVLLRLAFLRVAVPGVVDQDPTHGSTG